MNKTKTIDLWTEQKDNQIECFCGHLLMALIMKIFHMMHIKLLEM